MDPAESISDYAALCMKCMKGHITDHSNLDKLKMDVRSCEAATAKFPREMFHHCVKEKIKEYISMPCTESCRIPPDVSARTLVFSPFLLVTRPEINSFL